MKIYSKNKIGFTLIELLMVIAIIAILTSLGLQYLFEARKEGRDNARGVTVEQLALSFKLIQDAEGSFPTGNLSEIKVDASLNTISQKIVDLYPNFKNDPLEDSSGSNYGYYYDSDFVCSSTNQRVVFARLESPSNSNFSQVCTASTPDTFPNSWSGEEMYIMIIN